MNRDANSPKGLLQRTEFYLLTGAFVVVAIVFSYIKLADRVQAGVTQSFDDRILRSLRQVDNPAIAIGPSWVQESGLDATALGSPFVLVLIVLAVIGLMAVRRRYGLMLLTVAIISVGAILQWALKLLVGRDRPSVVPHLREVDTTSFPSGHAMLSAIVYLSLGILLTAIVPGRPAKVYVLVWAMVLTFIVGFSRMYLGVHYPTDVLGGWMAGLAWALACWVIVHFVRLRREWRAESISRSESSK